jgi:hypothetical protein
MPALRPEVPPQHWRLGAEGLAAARQLRLPADAYLVSSDEPKAADTLRAATGVTEVPTDAAFGEVRHFPDVVELSLP